MRPGMRPYLPIRRHNVHRGHGRMMPYGIITSKPPLARLRVCIAHASVPAHRALRTLNPAKPQ